MSIKDQILDFLPHRKPFRFVNTIDSVDEKEIIGRYHFGPDENFYQGHFPEKPITPGVILIECGAQICLVAHTIFHLLKKNKNDFKGYEVAFTSSNVEFLKPVWPDTEITAVGQIEYIRFNKVKTKVKMTDDTGDVVCKGEMTGMFFNEQIKQTWRKES